ncbi:MAG: 30S ribosomal protein S8, partial [Candidatus Omnitrophica bacterium]|nr:30S ribosomal protein S8 [Candidatus Omnitrophota bacterium]
MARTDLIADIFTIIRNASFVKKEWTQIPASNMIKSILDILKREGYIENFKVIESGTEQKQENLRVYLKYFENGLPALKNLKRISRSGLRVYAKSNK